LVVDTMVFVYAALNVQPFRDDCYAVLTAGPDVIVPESLLAELLNAAWMHVRKSGLSVATAEAALDDALSYVARRVPIDDLWHDGLRLAVAAGHSPYDTLFVALAEREGTQVITYDAKLLTTFPGIAVSPAEYLASP
jgi:predicted nucleic acid-binding protein